jgi:hypothetical protein
MLITGRHDINQSIFLQIYVCSDVLNWTPCPRGLESSGFKRRTWLPSTRILWINMHGEKKIVSSYFGLYGFVSGSNFRFRQQNLAIRLTWFSGDILYETYLILWNVFMTFSQTLLLYHIPVLWEKFRYYERNSGTMRKIPVLWEKLPFRIISSENPSLTLPASRYETPLKKTSAPFMISFFFQKIKLYLHFQAKIE